MRLGNIVAIALLAISCCIGCTDARRAQYGALGAKHKVELFSGGKCVREWTSTGKPNSARESDGYYFVDEESGELVEVSGNVVMTQLK